MKIVMMTGSAHRNGTTATLAGRFQQGALDAGHEVFRQAPISPFLIQI